MPRAKKTKCCIDGCKNDAVRRGLCDACWRSANRAVNAEKTTWEKLEEQGLAKPLNVGTPFTVAFRRTVAM